MFNCHFVFFLQKCFVVSLCCSLFIFVLISFFFFLFFLFPPPPPKKTLMMWLANDLIYTHMSVFSPPSIAMDRAIALHKLIVSFSWVLGGDAVLTFFGNEFGHPEWVDFPRAGNNESFQYARRQWSLSKDPLLRYGQLERWTVAVLALDEKHHFLKSQLNHIECNEQRQTVSAQRSDLLWMWNWNSASYTDAILPEGHWRVLLSSDDEEFGGHKRVQAHARYSGKGLIYLPSRTLIVLAKEK